jgi:hypothetical protein
VFSRAWKAKRKLLLGCVVASFATTANVHADGPEPECSPTPAEPLKTIQAFVSDGIAPLKDTYFKPDFELDETSSNIAALENEVDPPEKRKTFTFLIRGDGTKQTLSRFQTANLLNPSSPYGLYWSNGVATIWNFKIQELNSNQGISLPSQTAFGTEDIKKLSVTELTARLKTAFAEGNEKTAQLSGAVPGDPRDFTMMASYLKLTSLGANDQAVFNSTLGELKTTLTWNEKIRFAQTIGGAAGARYDYARFGKTNPTFADGTANPGLSAGFGKSIPAMAVLANLHTTDRLGICRDIAPLQAQVLQGLGFKHTYAIGYNAGGNHAAVIAQNPEHPNEILHFNYDGLERGDLRQGMRSLTRGEDYSTRYDIFTPEGKSVATLPSELGNLMLEGAGGNIKNLDPFNYRATGSIAKLTYDGQKSQIPIFIGQTSAGDKIIGIGNTRQFGSPDKNIVSATTTLGAAYQRKDAAVYSDEKKTFDAFHLNLTSVVDVNSHWKKLATKGEGSIAGQLTSTTVLHGDGALSGLTAYRQETAQYKRDQAKYESDIAKWQPLADQAAANGEAEPPHRPFKPQTPASIAAGGTGSATFEVGANAKFVSPDGQTKLDGRIANQFALGTTDLSASTFNRIYTNVTYATVSGEKVILPEKLVATFNTAVGLRTFGTQVLVQTGVYLPANGIKTDVGVQKSNKGALTIAPGSNGLLYADFEKDFRNSLILTASYQQPLGMSVNQPMIQVGAKGSLSEMVKKKKKPAKLPPGI